MSARMLSAALTATTGLLIAATAWSSVERAGKDGRFLGEEVAVGDGTARAYVNVVDGKPAEVGIALSERALKNLPAHAERMPGAHGETVVYIVPVPAAAGSPYRFVELDWNPMGHEPPGIYDLPHFDFHFETITNDQRLAIVPTDPDYAKKARNVPPAAQMPKGYVSASVLAKAPEEAVSVPKMGLHWLDPKTPELNGQKFTKTFIYGTWDGQLIFAEPMITKEYLESKPDFAGPIAQPEQYPEGYFPTGQSIRWDAKSKEWRIALTGLKKH